MSTLETAPELADGGYWYVVEAVPDPDIGGQTPGNIPGKGWCAWYGEIDGVMYAAVRCPEPVTGVNTAPAAVSAVLAAAGYSERPRGRIGGS